MFQDEPARHTHTGAGSEGEIRGPVHRQLLLLDDHAYHEQPAKAPQQQNCSPKVNIIVVRPFETPVLAPHVCSLSFAVTPMEWEKMSDVNLAKADKQKDGSASLRALVDSILEQTSGDMQKQVQATTEAFQLNIQEIRSAKSQMEDQLAKVGQR